MQRRSNPRISARYQEVLQELAQRPRVWLITGVAGFIGSSLLDQLLALKQSVVGLDNFSTGSQANIDEVLRLHPAAASSFRLVRGDVLDLDVCRAACAGVDTVLHHASFGSVPRSIDDPAASNAVNVSGFLNMLIASRDASVRRFVFASSSTVYGDSSSQPHVEDSVGLPLSPHAVSSRAGELYATCFQRAFGLEVIGLRYFSVFGPRQDPNDPHADVIPRWIGSLLNGTRCRILGDGETTHDFCFVANAVQANILAAVAPESATNEVYNIACGESATLGELFRMIRLGLAGFSRTIAADPVYETAANDIRDSLANIDKAKERLGYAPSHSISQGLSEAIGWYVARGSHALERTSMIVDNVSGVLEGVG